MSTRTPAPRPAVPGKPRIMTDLVMFDNYDAKGDTIEPATLAARGGGLDRVAGGRGVGTSTPALRAAVPGRTRMMNAIGKRGKAVAIPLHDISLDPELQPRAEIDRAVFENYAQLLVDGATFPPVTVFRVGEQLLLADGFHRWHAHNALQMESIAAEILVGSRRDALLHSLSANAKHGLPRARRDLGRAYDIAVRNELVTADNPEAVAKLLSCSVSRAYELTEAAREAARAKREAAIVAAKEAGKSNREIAQHTGTPRQTVDRVLSGPNFQPGKMGQDEPPASTQPNKPPVLSEAARSQLAELETPAAKAWSSALRALRLINEQLPVDDLFADRFVGFDYAFRPELDAAFAWINELHRNFHAQRNQRRRA